MPDANDSINDVALPRLDIRKSFTEQPPALDFVLPGMIAGTVGALVAQGGAGKSWVALEIAIGVAGGPDLLGMQFPAQGRVLYLPAEDPALAINHRLYSAREAVAGSIDQLAETLEIVPLMGRAVDLLVPAWAEAIGGAVRCLRPELILPDDVLSSHQEQLAWLADALKEPFAGRTVVVTHHCPSPSALGADNRLAPAFCSNLETWIATQPVGLWLFGHTHRRLRGRAVNTPAVNVSLG